MMLSLIKDVFTEAHSVLDPTTAGVQRTSAGRAVESISIVLDWEESPKHKAPTDSSSSEAMLAGLEHFLAGTSPHLLSMQNSTNIG